MYINILKKDLKRKKTMNIILMLFVVLASMLVSSSVNNMIAVSTALDDYFEMAQMPDYLIFNTPNPQLDELLDNSSNVTLYQSEEMLLFGGSEGFSHNGEQLEINQPIISSISSRCINYYDENNQEITSVEKGEVYMFKYEMDGNNLSAGDTVTVEYGERKLDLKIKGYVKDACFGSQFISLSRFLIGQEDFDYLSEDQTNLVNTEYVSSNNVEKLSNELSDSGLTIYFYADVQTLKLSYIMEQITAFSLFIVSAILILITFAILRFTINFTLEEEYREIGVMKAIGIKNIKIRGIYLVKFFAISCIGSALGFLFGIPFGKLMLSSASQNMVINSIGGIYVNALCSFAVIAIVVLFCFRCTRKIKKFTPIDAVRSGTTGERFKKKSKLSLARLRTKPSISMALNDILSSPKRYVVMVLTFSLSLMMIVLLANTVYTFKSPSFVEYFGRLQRDIYISMDADDSDSLSFYETVAKECESIEKTLEENDMSATCCVELQYKMQAKYNGNSFISTAFQGVNSDAADYKYTDGTPPQNENEIAITSLVSEKLGAEIGDTVTISDSGDERSFIVSAKFQSLTNLGEGIRFHQDTRFENTESMGISAFEIDFDDEPSKSEIDSRVDKLKEIYNIKTICDSENYVDSMIGDTASYINSIKGLVLVICLVICALVVVLMERSFISKEKNEIALLKAIGFKNSSISLLHVLRIAFVMLAATVVGSALSIPATMLTSGQVFAIMGATNMEFSINALEVFVLYPALILVCTLTATALTSLCIRNIKTSEITNIE